LAIGAIPGSSEVEVKNDDEDDDDSGGTNTALKTADSWVCAPAEYSAPKQAGSLCYIALRCIERSLNVTQARGNASLGVSILYRKNALSQNALVQATPNGNQNCFRNILMDPASTMRKKGRSGRVKLAALLAGLAIFGGAAFGDEKNVIQSPAPEKQEEAPLWSLDLNSDYTLGSKIIKSGSFGSQAVYHYQIEALRNIHLFDKYYFQFGIDSERFDFSRSNIIYPSSIASVAGEFSLSYWTGDDYYQLLKFEPGIYYTRDYITAKSLDVPIRAVAGFKVRENTHLVLGVDVDPFEQEWAIPICGFNWKINDQYNLRAVFPQPRFSYTPSKEVEFFLAADLVGGGYRNGPTNDRRTNNALLDYSEYRAGSGVNYNPKTGLSFEMTAGWSIQRRFDYFRGGPDDSSKSAPYVKVDISIDL